MRRWRACDVAVSVGRLTVPRPAEVEVAGTWISRGGSGLKLRE